MLAVLASMVGIVSSICREVRADEKLLSVSVAVSDRIRTQFTHQAKEQVQLSCLSCTPSPPEVWLEVAGLVGCLVSGPFIEPI